MVDQESKAGLFKKEEVSRSVKPKKEKPLDPRVIFLLNEVSNISAKLRLLEERYANLRKKTQVTDQNMLESNRKITIEPYISSISL